MNPSAEPLRDDRLNYWLNGWRHLVVLPGVRSVLAAVAALVVPSLVAVPLAVPAAAGAERAASPSDLPRVSAPARVTVANMAFGPARVTVGVGETVTWTFQDSVSHSATSDDGFFDTGLASGGQTRSVRFRSAGTYPYHCLPHPHMSAKVAVPVRVTGGGSEGWKLVWLAGDNPRGRSYDVQVRRIGTTTWTYLWRDTTKASGRYDPGSGKWQVRARTLKGAKQTGWSPVTPLS